MAGETPRANDRDKKKKEKRKLNWQNDRSTDKYYGSGEPSAVQRSRADTVGRPGSRPKPIPVNTSRADERNADKKYYANPAVPGNAPAPLRVSTNPRASKAASPASSRVTIHAAADVNVTLTSLIASLQNDTPVVVEVVGSDILRRARAKLDLMVTGETITEDQARNVSFVKIEAGPVLDLSKPPVPAATVSIDAEPEINLDDVLNGKTDVSDNFMDVSADVNAKEAEVTEEEADDGDFLSPPAAAELTTVEEPSLTETLSDADETPIEDASPEPSSLDESEAEETARPKKSGRRSGRGTK